MKELKLAEKLGMTKKQLGYMFLGNLIYALCLDFFFVGNNIAAGGLAGLGTVINSFFHFPIGLTVFIMNIPIGIWGLKVKGKKYILLSAFNIGFFSLLVDLLSFLPCLTHDRLVAVVCGGMLYGTASAFSVRAQISTGGTDLLAKLIITKKKSLTLGKLYMILDGTIVLIATICYGNIESGIYAILAIGVSSMVTDKLNSGFNKASMFYVFVNNNMDKITEEILYELNRGGTILNGKGLYTNQDKQILFIVVSPTQVHRLEQIVHKYDPTAFMVLCSASEIIGQGFRRLDLTSSIEEESKDKSIKCEKI